MAHEVTNLVDFEGHSPSAHPEAFLAPTATLVGAVTVDAGASVWFGAVLRADFERIDIGSGTAVQDNAVVHCAPDLPTVVGQDVIVGHGALLEGCTISDGAVLGMGCVVLQRAIVGSGAMVAAGCVVAEGQEILPGHLAVGAPARIVKKLSGSSARWVASAAPAYRALVSRYRGGVGT